MSLMDEMTNVVTVGRELLTTVSGKINEIDKSVAAAVKAIPELYKELYVAPDGKDSSLGNQSNPLATIEEAANRIPVGGSGMIYLQRGGAYYIQEKDAPWWNFVNIDNKSISIDDYGDANLTMPIIRIRAFNSDGVSIAKGFAAYGDATLFVKSCQIETPAIATGAAEVNPWRVGGLMSRESGGGSDIAGSVGPGSFVVGISGCRIVLGDHSMTSHMHTAYIVLDAVEVEHVGTCDAISMHARNGQNASYIISSKDLTILDSTKTINQLFPHATSANALSNIDFGV